MTAPSALAGETQSCMQNRWTAGGAPHPEGFAELETIAKRRTRVPHAGIAKGGETE